MKIGDKIRHNRKNNDLTQQQLADKLHVTRQALSKWENNLNYPNLDVLFNISKILHISLNELLGEEENGVVKRISNDVRKKRRYTKYFIAIGIFLLLIGLSSGIFIYGRLNQIDRIDVLNPFLETQYGYAVLPDKVPINKTKEKVHYSNGKSGYKILNEPQQIDSYVRSDPFGGGQWLKFSTGEYNRNHRWALIKYKGSFVFNARPVAKNHVPINIRDIIGNRYDKYDGYINSGPRSNSIFNNF